MFKKTSILVALGLFSATAFSQTVKLQPKDLPNWRPYDQTGVNVFEPQKDNNTKFDGVNVRFGAGFTQQWQSLKHENAKTSAALYPRLSPGFGIAQANLNMDVLLADGISLNLITYLSARHHNEAWVKGGYIQFDKLPFFKSTEINNLMNKVRVKVGHMEVNYGDAHFRRSDGGHTLYNPFIENYIMDGFATEVAGEVYYMDKGFTGMIGLSNGLINGGYQAPMKPAGTYTGSDSTYKRNPSIYAKLAYDTKMENGIRARIAGSVYHNGSDGRSTLFGGDRTGSNYFFVMEPSTANAKDNPFSGRVNPFNSVMEITAMQVNALLTAKLDDAAGVELFATYETGKGRNSTEVFYKKDKRKANQFAVDGILRLGVEQNIFLGARYNQVKGQTIASSATSTTAPTTQTISRFALGGGWFVTKNVMAKAEYVSQKYDGYPTGNIFNGGKFNGIVFEATVGF